MFVTEDTVRTDPETIERLYSTAIRCGATSLVLCDTVGHATPMGAYSLVQFVREEIVAPSRCAGPRGLAWPLRPRLGRGEFLAAILAGARPGACGGATPSANAWAIRPWN